MLALAFVQTTIVGPIVETNVAAVDPIVETTVVALKLLTPRLERSEVAVALGGLSLRPPGFLRSIALWRRDSALVSSW